MILLCCQCCSATYCCEYCIAAVADTTRIVAFFPGGRACLRWCLHYKLAPYPCRLLRSSMCLVNPAHRDADAPAVGASTDVLLASAAVQHVVRLARCIARGVVVCGVGVSDVSGDLARLASMLSCSFNVDVGDAMRCGAWRVRKKKPVCHQCAWLCSAGLPAKRLAMITPRRFGQ